MVKRVGSLLLALALCVALFPVSALAADNDFTIENGVLIRYNGGSGDRNVVIPDGVTEISVKAFYGCRNLTSVTIPASVTSIENGAFGKCTGLTSIDVSSGSQTYTAVDGVVFSKDMTKLVSYPGGKQGAYTIPSGVTSIGHVAFLGCTGLTSVIIPSSVTSMGYSAFSGCTGLTSVTIGSGVTSIGEWAFSDCTSLTSVTIPSSVTYIDLYAFSDCRGLTDVYYGGTEAQWGVMEIDRGNDELTKAAIRYNGSMPEVPTPAVGGFNSDFTIKDGALTKYNGSGGDVVIPDGVTKIEYGAFASCTGLTGVTIPDSVTSIGEEAFYKCSNLTSVTIPDSVTSIGDLAFLGCTGLTSVTIGSGVTSIGASAFNGCTGLTSVTIPSSVTSIGDLAFYGCTGLTSVTIPASVTSIGEWAFYGCTGLTGVSIPNSVTSIGDWAFYGCTGLTGVTIGSGVTSMGYSAFWGCTSLTSVTIGSGVTSIGAEAFYGCTSLTSVTIPDSVTSIGNSAFNGTPWLKSLGEFAIVNGILFVYQGSGGGVTIPDSVTSIGSIAFVNCTGLTSVIIPTGVTSIGWCAFTHCTSLTDVYYGGTEAQWGVMEIDRGNDELTKATIHYNSTMPEVPTPAVGGFNSDFTIKDGVLTEYTGAGGDVVIPDGVTSIGEWAFYGCSGLTSVTIPSSVTSIGAEAFYGCTSLTSVTIPDSVTSIGEWAFYGCSGLTSVTIPAGVTSIGEWAFYGCSGLTSVTIPSSVTSIGEYAFDGCTSLTSVSIPNSVTCIGNSAFNGCTGLTSVTIPSSVTSIGDWAFYGCTGLTDVYYGGSEAQWSAIEIDGWRNKPLTDATIHYNSPMPEVPEPVEPEPTEPEPTEPEPTEPEPAAVSFADVPSNAWYADAVNWAVEKGITNGTGDNTFSPEKTCSHVEIVTFLYRAEGSPAASGTAPIEVQSWFADAVNWAYGAGIIDASFDPTAECTRADTVSYMWKAADSPAAEGGGFSDVPAGAAYTQAVAWAVDKGVTTGTGDGKFSPGDTCTRGHIVTFLSRAYGK